MTVLEKLSASVSAFFQNLTDTIVSIFPGLVLILMSLLIALVVGFLFRILFRLIKIDQIVANSSVPKTLKAIGVDLRLNVLLGNIVFWVVFVLLLDSVASVSGWVTISDKFVDFTSMIPLLLGAVIIVAVGVYLSRLISNITKAVLLKAEARTAGLLSNIVFYALLIVVITIALSFIGVSTTIITANIAVILGCILLAFSISFVFGAKDLLKNILSSSYNKSNYKVGQKVEIDGFEGEIIKITNVSVIVKSPKKIRVFPASRFIDEYVDIVG